MAGSTEGNSKNSVSWSGMSFEMKAFFAFHVSMMVMMVAGSGLAFLDKALIAGAIALSLSILSAIRRLRRGWRWRGASVGRWLFAVLNALLFCYFIGAVTGFSLAKFERLGPWAFAGIGIGVFGVLNILQIVHRTEAGFLSDCGEGTVHDYSVEREPAWKRVLGVVYSILFLVVWLAFVTFFYVRSSILSASSPIPTMGKTVAMAENGRTVYVSPADKNLVDLLQLAPMVGIPSIVTLGFFLQFVLKVRLNPVPTD